MKIYLSIILSFFAMFGHAQNDTTKRVFSKNEYSITYPKEWQLDTSKLMGSDFVIFSPMEDDSDSFSENVNGMIQSIDSSMKLEDYKNLSEKQIKEYANEGAIYESALFQGKHGTAYRIHYAMKQGKRKLEIVSVCYIRQSKAYLITFCSEENKYNQYAKLSSEILDSFRLN